MASGERSQRKRPPIAWSPDSRSTTATERSVATRRHFRARGSAAAHRGYRAFCLLKWRASCMFTCRLFMLRAVRRLRTRGLLGSRIPVLPALGHHPRFGSRPAVPGLERQRRCENCSYSHLVLWTAASRKHSGSPAGASAAPAVPGRQKRSSRKKALWLASFSCGRKMRRR